MLALTATADESLKSALLFHVSFDKGADADFATGERQILTAPGRKRTEPKPGITEADGIEIAKGEGRFGDAEVQSVFELKRGIAELRDK